MTVWKKNYKKPLFTSTHRSLYIGRLEHVLKRVNVSPVLLISLEGQMTLLGAPDNRLYHSQKFLIPAGMSVSIKRMGPWSRSASWMTIVRIKLA